MDQVKVDVDVAVKSEADSKVGDVKVADDVAVKSEAEVNLDDVKPGDSASQCGRSSTSSTTSRLKALARRAGLEAEAEALAEKQELEFEEFRLKQRKAQLKMRTQLKVAKAEERVFTSQDEEAFLPDGLARTPPKPFIVQASTPSNLRPDEDETIPYLQPRTDPALLQLLQVGQLQQQRLLESVSLPHADLTSYDGNPLKYHEFLRSFENSVDQTSVDDSVKLTRLLHYCTGDVKKILQPYAIMKPSEGYSKAKAMLERKYGNPVIIADAWLRKVTEGKRLSPQDKRGLEEMSDELLICVQTLEVIGQGTELTSQRVLLQIAERLPYHLRARWLKVVARARREFRLPSIADMVSFLQDVAIEENDPVFGKLMLKEQSSKTSTPAKKTFGKSSRGAFTTETYTQGSKKTCVKCNGDHSLFGCTLFKQLRPEDRMKFAQKERLCYNCLQKGHMTRACKINRTCTVTGCNRKHTKFLHISGLDGGRDGTVPRTNSSIEEVTTSNSSCSNVIGAGIKVALPIIPVRVRAEGKDKFYDTYALLDSGSTSTFCTTELSRKIGAEGVEQRLSMSTLEKLNSTVACKTVSMVVESLSTGHKVNLPRVYAKQRINVSTIHIANRREIEQFSHLADLDLPVVSPEGVMLLIGQDVPEVLVPLDVRYGKPWQLYAVKTVLGWTVNGPVGNETGDYDISSSFISSDANLELQVEKFWSLESTESLSDQTKCMSINDKRALGIWEDSILKKDGHYQLSIPFKERPPELADNFYAAEKRLQSLGRRLKRDKELHGRYTKAMSGLMEEGYAEMVPQENVETDSVVWYLPHHPVLNPKKPDKTRIVFDCAAKCQGTSLNDAVLPGPDMTNKLLGVLLRFRQEPTAVMADIQAMFHQVQVPPEERDVLRFLWWPDGVLDQRPKVYRMCVHLFGGTWSPSCCSFALKRTAEDHNDEFSPEAVKAVAHNFYVDDCLVSCETEQKAVEIVAELRSLLEKGGFKLTKWTSNNANVLASIPEQDRSKKMKGLDLNREALPFERALGTEWNTELDFITYKITPKDKPLTRRGLLSEVSSVYDPYGFAAPYVLYGKMLLQELTAIKLGWDDPIPDEYRVRWQRWKGELPLMEDVKVSRCYRPYDFGQVMEYQLHHFCDASERAYGVVTYLRMENSYGQVSCNIVMAKSRLTPLKKVTIPRLELMAATLAVTIERMIKRELDLPLSESAIWTDSTIVLHYISNEDKRFHTFVANRITAIRDGSEPRQWKHVSSDMNPADDITRGLSPNDMHGRWLRGPEFLYADDDQWPKSLVLQEDKLEGDPEVRGKDRVGVYMTAHAEGAALMNKLIERYSSWYRLKRAVSWLRRFLAWLRSKRNSEGLPDETFKGRLTIEEMSSAEEKILQYEQRVAFPEEIATLKDDTDQGQIAYTVKTTSPVYKLDPRMMKGLLRVGGRLGKASLPMEAKHPIILRKDRYVTKLILSDVHEAVGHGGRNHMLSHLNKKYWVPAASSIIRGILSRCIICRRQRGKVLEQKMADLPEDRLTAGETPFSRVGVDYFGPFEVKRGRSVIKRYGVLFTCLAVRAVHIEMADSLDTDSCINAIRRFMARRGNVREIRSDNGTNFVGAERELRAGIQSWNQTQIHDALLQQNVKWTFNPPRASHHGGVWERQIRTVRKLMRSLVRQQTLTDDSLNTLFCEIESIMNSRPITKVSSDVNDFEALTPNHLLLLSSNSPLPPTVSDEADVYARRRWKQVQYLADTFWSRWVREYLPQLQERQKWNSPRRNVQVGDLVLVVDEQAPRNFWPMGRVLQTMPDRHGNVRQCEVKTQSSVLRRPIAKLCLLLEADS